MTQDPSACLATRPTSTVRSRSPNLIDSFKYFFTVISVRLLLTRPAHPPAARSVSSAAILFRDRSGTSSLALQSLKLFQRASKTPALQSKKEKAAEPGREALCRLQIL